MTQPILNQSGIAAPVSQSEAAAMPQLVKVDGKVQASNFTQFGDDHICPSGSERRLQPGEKQPRRLADLSLEPSQQPQFISLDRVQSGPAVLEPIDVHLRSFKIYLRPSQADCLTHSQTVTITDQHQGVIPHRS